MAMPPPPMIPKQNLEVQPPPPPPPLNPWEKPFVQSREAPDGPAPGASNLADIQAARSAMIAGHRSQSQQAINAQTQQGSDALTRRFAAMGMSGSGANIAANLKLNEQAHNARTQADVGLNAEELQGQQQDLAQRNLESGRETQRQQFGTEQANKLAQLDLAQKQFQLDTSTTAANRIYADRESRNSGGK